jgi:uncharacterized membrane protein
MTARYTEWTMGRSAKTVAVLGVLAVLLVLAVPAALFVGVVMMLLGHVVGGLAVFGASVLLAVAGVTAAFLSGARQLRKLVSQPLRDVVRLGRGEYDYS